MASIKRTLAGELARVKSGASLEAINKLVRNCAQNPREEKYRRVRTTNHKVHAVLVAVDGAMSVMATMGWVQEGEFLVLPAGVHLSMREVRDIEDATLKLKRAEEQAKMRAEMKLLRDHQGSLLRDEAFARANPEMKLLENDRHERAAGPEVTKTLLVDRHQQGLQMQLEKA